MEKFEALVFEPMPSVFPDQAMWGASRNGYSFIITEEDGEYRATARKAYTPGEPIVKGNLMDLGTFMSMTAAVEACVKWRIQ